MKIQAPKKLKALKELDFRSSNEEKVYKNGINLFKAFKLKKHKKTSAISKVNRKTAGSTGSTAGGTGSTFSASLSGTAVFFAILSLVILIIKKFHISTIKLLKKSFILSMLFLLISCSKDPGQNHSSVKRKQVLPFDKFIGYKNPYLATYATILAITYPAFFSGVLFVYRNQIKRNKAVKLELKKLKKYVNFRYIEDGFPEGFSHALQYYYLDGWGNPLICLFIKDSLAVISKGEDGILGTDDDFIVYLGGYFAIHKDYLRFYYLDSSYYFKYRSKNAPNYNY